MFLISYCTSQLNQQGRTLMHTILQYCSTDLSSKCLETIPFLPQNISNWFLNKLLWVSTIYGTTFERLTAVCGGLLEEAKTAEQLLLRCFYCLFVCLFVVFIHNYRGLGINPSWTAKCKNYISNLSTLAVPCKRQFKQYQRHKIHQIACAHVTCLCYLHVQSRKILYHYAILLIFTCSVLLM